MVGILDSYISLNLSIGTVIKILESIKFVSDHLNTKKTCKHVAENYLIY